MAFSVVIPKEPTGVISPLKGQGGCSLVGRLTAMASGLQPWRHGDSPLSTLALALLSPQPPHVQVPAGVELPTPSRLSRGREKASRTSSIASGAGSSLRRKQVFCRMARCQATFGGSLPVQSFVLRRYPGQCVIRPGGLPNTLTWPRTRRGCF